VGKGKAGINSRGRKEETKTKGKVTRRMVFSRGKRAWLRLFRGELDLRVMHDQKATFSTGRVVRYLS